MDENETSENETTVLSKAKTAAEVVVLVYVTGMAIKGLYGFGLDVTAAVKENRRNKKAQKET